MNNSVISDIFTAFLRSETKFLECNHNNVKFNTYSTLTLPVLIDTDLYNEALVNRCRHSCGDKRNDDDDMYVMYRESVIKVRLG